MARICRERNVKLIMGIVLTFVMIVSLFAGIGTIWVKEDTHTVSAEELVKMDGDKLLIGTKDTTKDLYSEENPFLVLEIVPDANMAQFGYLVEGQEPIDLAELAKSSVVEDPETQKALKDYLSISKVDSSVTVKEFSSLLSEGAELHYTNASGEDAVVHYGDAGIIWDYDASTAPRYGTYTKDDNGSWALLEKRAESFIGYNVVDNTDGSTPAGQIVADTATYPKNRYADAAAVANAYTASLTGAITVGSAIYVPTTKNGGIYSGTKYTKVTDRTGDYSDRYMYVGEDDGGMLGDTIKEVKGNYVTTNKIRSSYSSYYTASNNSDYRFADNSTFVVFRVKDPKKDAGKPTYDIKSYPVTTAYYNDGGWFSSDTSSHYNKYYKRVETTDTNGYPEKTGTAIANLNELKNNGYILSKGTKMSDYNGSFDAAFPDPSGIYTQQIEIGTYSDWYYATRMVFTDNTSYRYSADNKYIYFPYNYYGDIYYIKLYYTYDVYKYYNFVYDATPKTNDTAHYHVIFEYKAGGNGHYVVDETATAAKTSYNHDLDRGMTYSFSGTGDWDWKGVGANSGDYLAGDYSAMPQYVGDDSGNYLAEELATPVLGVNTDSVKYSKDYNRFDIIPVYSPDEKYNYSIVSFSAVSDGDKSFIIGRYNGTGLNYSESTAVTNPEDYSIPDYLKGPSDKLDSAPDEIPYTKNETFSIGYFGTYKNYDLFKKYSIGLAYKNNNVRDGEDVDSFTFKGWYTDPQGVNEYVNYGIKQTVGEDGNKKSDIITDDVTLYAKWLITRLSDTTEVVLQDDGTEVVQNIDWNGYTVTFDSNIKEEGGDATLRNMPGNARVGDDSESSAITEIRNFNKGSYLVMPSKIPTRQNYIFEGWYTKDNPSQPDTDDRMFVFLEGDAPRDDTDKVDGNITLYAHWKHIDWNTVLTAEPSETPSEDYLYDIAFDYNIGYGVNSSMPRNTQIEAESMPKGTEITNVARNGRRYSATVNEGGTILDLYKEIDVDTDYSPSVKGTSGYVFAGWYIDRSCRTKFNFDQASMIKAIEYRDFNAIVPGSEGEEGEESESTDDKLHLYAKWVKTSSNPTYSVILNANKPAEALSSSEVKGLPKDNKVSVAFNQSMSTASINDLSLIGNVEAKLDSYKVKVVTVTPQDLDASTDNFNLISKANLIVINETCDPKMVELSDNLTFQRNKTWYNKRHTGQVSFSQNDLSWATVIEILTRITGVKYEGNSRKTVVTCPVLFDYNIYSHALNSTYAGTKYLSSVTISGINHTGDKDRNSKGTLASSEAGSSVNAYKLYLLTQVASPMTLYNAFFSKAEGRYGKYINSNGIMKTTAYSEGATESDDANKYWNPYTLIPYNVLSMKGDNNEWNKATDNYAYRRNQLELIGFKTDVSMDSGISDIKNRMFVYNIPSVTVGENTKALNIVSGYLYTALGGTGHKDINKMFTGSESAVRDYTTGEVFYFMLHSNTLYENLNRDIKILEIQPASFFHENEYWFYYISHFAPNITGDITSNSMSSLEFQCNIEDLNAVYDIIYIGTNPTRYQLSTGAVQSSMTEDTSDLSKIIPGSKSETVSTSTNRNVNTLRGKISEAIGNNHDTSPETLLPNRLEDSSGNVYRRGNKDTTGCSERTYNSLRTRILPANRDDNSYRYQYKRDDDYVYVKEKVGFSFSYYKYAYYKVTITTNSQYAYYHTGQTVKYLGKSAGTFSTVNKDGEITKDDDYTKQGVYGGNDFTYSGYKKVAEFLKAYYPIILDKGFFNSEDKLNDYLVDKSTWIYKLADELVNHNDKDYKVFRESDTDSSAFVSALKNKSFDLVVEKAPKKYVDRTKLSESLTDAQKDEEIYINGGASGSDHDIDFKKLYYEIKINEIDEIKDENRSYKLNLLIDTNADGKYSADTEMIDSIEIYDTVEKRSGSAASMELKGGRTYQVTRDIGNERPGVIAWKLQVVSLDNEGVRDEAVGISAIKVAEEKREVINVLQVMSTISGSHNTYSGNDVDGVHTYSFSVYNGETSVVLPTDPELYDYYTNRRSEIQYIGLDTHSSYPLQYVKDNTKKFHDYTFQLKDFEIHFYRINESTLATMADPNITKDSKAFKVGEKYVFSWEVDSRTGKGKYTIKKQYEDEHGVLVDNKPIDVTFGEMDMIIVGFAYAYDDIQDQKSRDLIQDFAESGNAVLFSNQTIYDNMISNSTIFNRFVTLDGFHTAYSGYYLTKSFRNFIGMDRYGALVNHGYLSNSDLPSDYRDKEIYDPSSSDHSNERKVISIEEQLEGKNSEGLTLKSIVFKDICIDTASEYTLKYDIPLANNTEVLLGTEDLSEETLASIKKVVYSDYNNVTANFATGDPSDVRAMVQGFSKNNLKTGAFTAVDKITQTNKGQIVSYPYEVGASANNGRYKYISTSRVRAQVLQLNTEDEDTVVWYTLYRKGDGKDVSASIVNDATNNYYIYSKGNITYTGIGFTAGTAITDDEVKLFVNTMAAAYRSVAHATIPKIKNPDKSSDDNDTRDYLYVDYDASISSDPSNDANKKPIAVGSGVVKTTEGGHEIYRKRVLFTLENKSIIFNKTMTVHYYPVIHDDNTGVDVVLYDYPLTNVVTKHVYKKKGEDGKIIEVEEDLKPDNSSRWSLPDDDFEITNGNKVNPGFWYSVPDGMELSAADQIKRNIAVVGVDSGYGKTDSLEQYCVYIPISKNYYDGLLTGGYTYTYKDAGGIKREATLSKEKLQEAFGLDSNSMFEIEIQVVMRYGRDQSKNKAKVGSRRVVFMKRGMFTLD